MAENEAYSLVGIKYQSTGAEKAAADGKNVAAGLDGVASSSAKASQATVSAEKSFDLLKKQLEDTARAASKQAKEQKSLDAAMSQGLVNAQQYAEMQAVITRRYNEQVAAATKAASAGKGVAADLDGVTVASDKTTKATASVGREFESLKRRVDDLHRAESARARDMDTLNKSFSAGRTDAVEYNRLQGLITQRYNEATKATAGFTAQTGLARHEMINLSRQAQDVVVSLQGGQGFGTVMLQQGSQILDVLGTSSGGIRGSLSALGTSFRSLFTVGRVAFAGIAGAVAGAAFATADYLAQQKEVERALIGAGRRSASPADINRIAGERSSFTGLSVSETREAALEFAKTGQIHSRVIGEMIQTTRNFALVTGQSSKEAATALAGAFTNIQGIDNLNKQFAFLDGNTRRYVEQLLLAGRTTEAAALANDRLKETLKGVEDTQGAAAKGWTAIGNAASDAAGKVGEYIAKAAGLQKTSKSDRAKELEGEISRLEGMGGDTGGFTGRLFSGQLEKYRAELAGLKADLDKIAQDRSFNALSAGASHAVAAVDPLRAKLDQVVGELTRLKDAQAAGINVPGLEMAVRYYEQIAEQLSRQAEAQDRLAAKYPGMTSEFAKQVEALRDQNALLKARENGTEATVAAAIAYKNAIAAGANETEAAAIKAETLKNNLLQASSAAASIEIQLDWSEFEAQVSQAESASRAYRGWQNTPSTMGQGGSNRSEFEVGANPFTNGWTDSRFFRAGDQSRAIMEADAERWAPIMEDHDAVLEELRRRIEDQTKATEANTQAITVALNPLYTQGRGAAIEFGYMHAAKGLDMMVQGGIPGVDSVPIKIMAQQGERVQVTPVGGSSNDNSKTVIANNNFYFSGDGSSNALRNSRQLGQRYGQLMAALS